MRLHWLGRCVRRKEQGIISGTLEDVEQSLPSLKSIRERIEVFALRKL